MINKKSSVTSLLRCTLLAATTLSVGCAVDDISLGQSEGSLEHAKKEKNKLLVASLGASTSAGVLFDPELLGMDPGMVFSDPNHLKEFSKVVEATDGEKVKGYNLAVPGATTADIVAEQLPELLEELPRYALGAVVTIEGGGNDLRAFQVEHIASCMSPQLADQIACLTALNTTIQTAAANVSYAISAIREVAPGATIIVQTQPNSLYGNTPLGTACADTQLLGIADLALEGDPQRGEPAMGLNVALRGVATAQGVQVADIAGYLYMTGEFSDPTYFSSDCTHLSEKGYELLLGSFINTL